MHFSPRVEKKRPQPAQPPQPEASLPLRPVVDPAEAVERIVPRRQLLFEDGDVIIRLAPSGASLTGRVYELRLRGLGPVPGRFVSFEHAAAAGDQVAAARRVRLFYVDASDAGQEIPHLLKDYRPTRGSIPAKE